MRLLPLLLAALLLAPIAAAHLQGARPVLQTFQRERIVGLQPDGLAAEVELGVVGEPLRHSVRHRLDPARGVLDVEYRVDASSPERFFAQWRFERLIEYRDLNVDGRYQPETDTAVKAWRFTHYQWRVASVNRVQVEDVRGNSIVWEANLTSAPHIRFEAVAAGKDFTDEGAIVRPQDIAIYLDFTQMPSRAVGSLYALEGSVNVAPDVSLSRHTVDNTTTAILADAPLRRALLTWGGEALLDGREQRVGATLGEARVEEDGRKSAPFALHIPTVDESMRFVMVSALEYGVESKRSPAPPPLALVVLALIVALARRT